MSDFDKGAGGLPPSTSSDATGELACCSATRKRAIAARENLVGISDRADDLTVNFVWKRYGAKKMS